MQELRKKNNIYLDTSLMYLRLSIVYYIINNFPIKSLNLDIAKLLANHYSSIIYTKINSENCDFLPQKLK